MKKLWTELSTTSIRNIVIVLIVVFTFVMMLVLLIKPIPIENKDAANLVIGGIMTVGFAGVIGYLFGSSKNESDKQKREGESGH